MDRRENRGRVVTRDGDRRPRLHQLKESGTRPVPQAPGRGIGVVGRVPPTAAPGRDVDGGEVGAREQPALVEVVDQDHQALGLGGGPIPRSPAVVDADPQQAGLKQVSNGQAGVPPATAASS